MLGHFPLGGAPLGGTISAAGPIQGTLSVTEANDTLSATATLLIQGTLSVTEAADILAATGAVPIVGTASITEAPDTVASTGVLPILAALAATEADSTVAATGSTGTSGTVSVTEQDDTAAATGAVAITGTLSETEANDTLASAGALAIRGGASIVLASVTLSASAQMPLFYPRGGGLDEHEEFERRQREWREKLRRIIDRSWLVAMGQIDPSTSEPIPPPDFSPVIRKLLDQAILLDHARAQAFIAEQKRLQEEEAVAILLLAA